MRKLLLATAVVALLAGGSGALARIDGVDITKNGFDTGTVAIESGDSVTWKNTDTAQHDVMVDGTTCKLSLEPGQSSSCTFASPGKFTYEDPNATGDAFAGTLTVS